MTKERAAIGCLLLLVAVSVAGCRQAERIAWAADAQGMMPLTTLGSLSHQNAHLLAQRKSLSNYVAGLLAEAGGDLQVAQEWYRQAHQHDSNSKQILLRLGSVQLRQDKLEEAVDSFEEASRLDPTDPRAQFLLGVLYTSQRRFDEAAKRYAQVLTHDPGNLGALSHLADIYILQEKLQEGVDVYESLLKERPDSSVAHFNVGVLYAKSEKWSEAIEHMARAVELNPSYIEARLGLAVSLEMVGRLEEARGSFAEALELEPYNTLLIHYLARISYRLGNLDEAAKWMTRYLGFRPRDYDAHLELGYIWIEQGDWEQAVQQIQYALEFHTLEEPPFELWMALGVAYSTGRKFEAAEESYRQAIRVAPEELKSYLYLGALYHRMQQLEEAERIYQAALQVDPEDPDLLNSLGYLYADWGIHLDESLGLIERALSEDPENGAYLDSLGWVYFKLGRLEEALTVFQEAAQLMPEAEIFLHLGQVYLEQGDLEAAKLAWEKGLAQGTEDLSILKHLKSQLETLKKRQKGLFEKERKDR